VANTAEQASPRATGQKQSLSLSTIRNRLRSRRARSIASSDGLGLASSPQALRSSPHQAGPSRAHSIGLQGPRAWPQVTPSPSPGPEPGPTTVPPRSGPPPPRRRDFFNLPHPRRPVDASPSIPFKARRWNFSLFNGRIPAHTVDVAPARDDDVSRSSLILPRL
jgi:hypothetical protein